MLNPEVDYRMSAAAQKMEAILPLRMDLVPITPSPETERFLTVLGASLNTEVTSLIGPSLRIEGRTHTQTEARVVKKPK